MQTFNQDSLSFTPVHGGATTDDATKFSQLNALMVPLFRALQQGVVLNGSENRRVGHMFMRGAEGPEDMMTEANVAMEAVKCFADDAFGQYSDIIHIGIGGSFLGPRMLSHFGQAIGYASASNVHFVTTDDRQAFTLVKRKMSVNAKVLVIVCSKSFTTRETADAMNMVCEDFPDAVLVAVTNNVEAANADSRISDVFYLPDWVGGRFSIWSGISLSVMLEFGVDTFVEFQRGAMSVDDAFFSDELDQINYHLALADAASMRASRYSRCVVPYSEALRYLPEYLQQLEMESLGKPGVPFAAVYGGMGVESQHSFFQYLHNAEQKPMVEFVVTDENPNTDVAKAQIAALVQNGTPCQLVILREAFWSFGALLAQYEYKVMRLAYLFNVNAYDQPAVELGKEIMRNFENGTCDDPIIEQLNKFI